MRAEDYRTHLAEKKICLKFFTLLQSTVITKTIDVKPKLLLGWKNFCIPNISTNLPVFFIKWSNRSLIDQVNKANRTRNTAQTPQL